jgi:hypothetical protein
MRRVLVNTDNEIVYEGIDAKEKLNNSDSDAEVRYEVHFDLKFRGMDDWHRPVFKDVNSSLHFGSTKLFNGPISNEEIIKYFKEHPEELEFFGERFNCEPHGGRREFFKFNILTY